MATTVAPKRRGDRRGDASRTTSGATLQRHKTLAIAGVLVLLGYLYLRSRSNASGIAVSTDPTAGIGGGGGGGIGYDPEATAGAIQDAQGGIDELAGQLADFGSALNDLSVQQAQDAADAQSSLEAAAISAQVYNDNTSLAVAGPTLTYSAPANINPAGEGTPYATAPTLLDAQKGAALGDYLVPGVTAPPRSTLTLYGTPDSSPTPAATSPAIGATTITNAPVASPAAIAAEPTIITSGSKPVMA